MNSIYDKATTEAYIKRINLLTKDSKPLWGKMSVDQMLSHCQAPIDFAFGNTPMKANFIMRILGRMLKGKILKSNQFKKDSPTAPSFIRNGAYDFDQTRNELIEKINKFSDLGTTAIKTTKHPFFGEMTHDEWSKLHTMHLEHHLRQFGV